MTQKVGYYVDLTSITIALNDKGKPTSWVHALPGGTYKHPVYGEMQFTDVKVTNLADSVSKKVRGIDPDIDYDHKTDKAMGNRAAGWVMGAETRPSSDGSKKDLWLLVEWTPNGAKSVQDKEYRYFSSEITDEWEDSQGTKHQDVLLGGGITNRPYMKNLMPLNLSELEFADSRPSTEGEQVDPKRLRQQLGLAETATDAEVDAKLSELTKPPTPPQTDPNDELKKLAEANPLVKAFMDEQTKTRQQLAEMQGQLTLANVMRQLTELTTGAKVQLSANALNEARDLMVALPTALGEKLFGLLKIVADGSGIVELGERAGGDPTRTGGEGDDPTKRFNDAIKALMDKGKLNYGAAAEAVALAEPTLFEQYRKSAYIKQQ